MGWRAQPTRQVILEGVRVAAANRVGPEGVGFKIAMAGLDGGRLNIGACSIGGGQSALDRKDADATKLCAMAKRFGTDVGFEVANQALQLHGGYGYLSEYGVEKIVRDLRVHQILEGTNEIMRLIVARKMIERAR